MPLVEADRCGVRLEGPQLHTAGEALLSQGQEAGAEASASVLPNQKAVIEVVGLGEGEKADDLAPACVVVIAGLLANGSR